MQYKIGRVDLHVHTIHSNCGKAGMTPTSAAKLYSARGYDAIGLTDHFDSILSSEKTRQTREELLETEPPIDTYVGTEACVYLPFWPRSRVKKLTRRYLDFCILSPSHHPSGESAAELARLPLEVQASRVLDSFLEAASSEFADAIAHPFAYGPSQIPQRDEVLSLIDARDLEWGLELAKSNGIAMELSPRVLGLGEPFLTRLFRTCMKVDMKFTIGGDVHSPESIGNDRLMHPLVEKFGIEETMIWYPEHGDQLTD